MSNDNEIPELSRCNLNEVLSSLNNCLSAIKRGPDPD